MSDFSKYAVNDTHQDWEKLIHRELPLYERSDDVRNIF